MKLLSLGIIKAVIFMAAFVLQNNYIIFLCLISILFSINKIENIVMNITHANESILLTQNII